MEPDTAARREPSSPERIREDVIDVLRTVYDPEIPVNIYDLGLVYQIDVDPEGRVQIRMTLTSPACPVAESLPGEVDLKVRAVPGVTDARIELVWDPPWDKDMMSEAARLQLGFF
jgi:FeS assembly SUF system protein